MHYEIHGVVLEQHIVCNLYRLGGFTQKREREEKREKQKQKKTAWLFSHTVILDKLRRQQLRLFLLETVIA